MQKAPRAKFALSGGRFPLNTPGRVQVAPKDAAIAERAGSITPAERQTVDNKAAAARGHVTHNPDNLLPRHAMHPRGRNRGM